MLKQKDLNEVVDSALAGYSNYHTDKDTVYKDEIKQNITDPRLRLARLALKKKPDSRYLQDRVIKLGVEFDKVNVSIAVLEIRLLNENTWQQQSVRFTYEVLFLAK